MNNERLKVYQCSDYDWFAALNAEQAADLYLAWTGDDEPGEEYPRELTDAELDVEYPEFDENEQPTGGITSIRKMLAKHGNEPGWLCGSEG